MACIVGCAKPQDSEVCYRAGKRWREYESARFRTEERERGREREGGGVGCNGE